jgi:hypothetical protein
MSSCEVDGRSPEALCRALVMALCIVDGVAERKREPSHRGLSGAVGDAIDVEQSR